MTSPFHALLRESTTPEMCREILDGVGLTDAQAALRRLRAIASEGQQQAAFTECLPMLMAMLRDAVSPDVSLVNLERFVQSTDDQTELIRYLAKNPRAIEILLRLFVGSQFLTEILIGNPHYLRELTLHSRIAAQKSPHELIADAQATIDAGQTDPMDAIRRFQQWELLRIGACDAFGLMDLRGVTRQLSLLADAVVQITLLQQADELQIDPAGFTVLAMGKLGGRELNYSSDIDLIFVTEAEPQNYWQLGQKLITALTATTANGFLYRVDMRLRPWGQSGALVNSVASHVDYLTTQGELWEKQAMLKARTIAGDTEVGRAFLERVAPIVFSSEPEPVREEVLEAKLRIERTLSEAGKTWGDVKSGPGSIRDIEFTAQYLQLVNGALVKDVRSANTLDALVRLAEFGFLHADEFRILTDAYGLLRTIEHSLQLVHARQTHLLPSSDRELRWLARRLGFLSADQLRSHFDESTRQVRRVFEKYVRDGGAAGEQQANSPVRTHRRKMGQSYTDVFDEARIGDHARRISELTDEEPVSVQTESAGGDVWHVTVIGRDAPGCLSVISGLLLAHGMDIIDGHVFTGIRVESTPGRARRFVDAFTVRCIGGHEPDRLLADFERELDTTMVLLYAGEFDEATSRVLKLVNESRWEPSTAAPEVGRSVDITIDNESSDEFTVLHIESSDTVGFLYELTNALTLSDIHIEQVELRTGGGRVNDTLHIARLDGRRIDDERTIQELRAAIVLIKHFTQLLPQSPDPRRALRQFREFLEDFFKRDDWVEELSSLQQSNVLDALARLLGVSDFLWMDFLRLQYENLFPVVRDVDQLREPRTRDELESELVEKLATAITAEEKRSTLNAFKDREMFRVDMRHIMDYCNSFTKFAAEMTDVADVTVAATVDFCFDELAAVHGEPQTEQGTPCSFTVCALGKCGGRELGYASDIELMFVYQSSGRTDGSDSIPNSAFFERLVNRFSDSIEAKQDGIFEIDLRLRPYGTAGSAAVAYPVFEEYFGPHGAAWPFERQALVKLRPIAGDTTFGQTIVGSRRSIVFDQSVFDRQAMHAMREKQVRQLVAPGTVNAKLSVGGLVDCEYLVQALQMKHGAKYPALQTTNTRSAIDTLHALQLIEDDDHQQLQDAHRFLRLLIDALRMVRGNARDLTVPPADSTDFLFLTRHLKYGRETDKLLRDLETTLANVVALGERLLD